MIKKLSVFGLFIMLTACASATLSPAGKNVRLIKSDPPENCQEIGQKTAMSGMGLIGAQNMLRNWAAEQGATHLRMDAGVETNTGTQLTGSAFKCPAK